MRFSTCFLRHVYFFTEKSPVNKEENLARLLNISLKTTAQAQANCGVTENILAKKGCAGLVSKRLEPFCISCFRVCDMTDIQGFPVHLLLICASLKSPSTLQHISTSHLAELAFFCPFFKLRESGIGHYSTFFYLGGLGVTFDLISW